MKKFQTIAVLLLSLSLHGVEIEGEMSEKGITLDQWLAKATEAFGKADADADGLVTREELHKFRETRRENIKEQLKERMNKRNGHGKGQERKQQRGQRGRKNSSDE